MSSRIQLIVGLANPGKEYAETRHNAGAWFVEKLAKDHHLELRPNKKFHGLYGLLENDNHTVHLLIPTTFMNLSGQSVAACMNFYKIIPSDILVVHDEIDLSVGTIKLKSDGGDGGHNGLRDIINHLNTKKFHRLRIGVGHPGRGPDVADHVLSKPSKLERKQINETMSRAESVLPFILEGHMQKAMNELHTENE